MLKVIDRIFACLLILGGVGHTIGTILWTPPMSGIFIWSLGAALAVWDGSRAKRSPEAGHPQRPYGEPSPGPESQGDDR